MQGHKYRCSNRTRLNFPLLLIKTEGAGSRYLVGGRPPRDAQTWIPGVQIHKVLLTASERFPDGELLLPRERKGFVFSPRSPTRRERISPKCFHTYKTFLSPPKEVSLVPAPVGETFFLTLSENIHLNVLEFSKPLLGYPRQKSSHLLFHYPDKVCIQ